MFGRHPLFESGDDLVIERLDLKTHQVSTLPGSKGRYHPVWSPDGRYVAAKKDGKLLVLFDSTTQKWEDLASVSGFYKSWSRDGKHLYFVSHIGNGWAIFRVGIANRKVEQVANLKDLQQVFGTWHTWFGLAPDNSPLLLRNTGNQEIYALDWEAP